MSYMATIVDPHDGDAAPWWESFDHADAQAALEAARTHIHTARPDDRIGADDGHGIHPIVAGPTHATRVATLVIAATDDHPPATPTASPQWGSPTTQHHRRGRAP